MSTTPPATGTEVAKVKKTNLDLINDFFQKDGVKSQLERVMEENRDGFIAGVIDLWTGDNYLQKCHPEEVAMTALKAAVLKLPVVKSLGYAYIVPFKSGDRMVPQLQIGWKGLVQLAIRTNQYEIIHADKVYEGEFRRANKLSGEFDLDGQRKGDTVIGYFAHIRMKTGFSKTLYMTKAEVTAHAQKYSKAYGTGPWKTEFDSMAIKTVLRRLLTKWGYMSIEMQEGFTEEDRDAATQVFQEFNEKANTTAAGFEDAAFTVDNANAENTAIPDENNPY